MKQQDEAATKKDLKKVEQTLQNVESGLQKLEDRLTTKIDANSTKIEANGKKIDANAAKIDANGARIDHVERNLGAKIDANSEAISRLTSLALENKDEIKKMATREYMDKRLDDIVTGQDKMIRLFMNVNQEQVAATARADRIEADVRENKTKIRELEAKVIQ